MGIPMEAKAAARTGKKRVTFMMSAQGAKQVRVTGDFTDWSLEKVPLREIHIGEWAASLELAPGEYQYRFLVDGDWRNDPKAARRLPNPFGSENDVLVVS